MELYLRKLENGTFAPLHDSDFEIAKKFKPGQDVRADLKKPRNYEFHKKFFALLNLGFQNTKSNIDVFEIYRQYALIKIGWCEIVKDPKGELQAIAKSISFAALDDMEFSEKVFKPMIQFCIFDTGATEEDIMENYINYF